MKAKVLALISRYEPVRTGGERYNREIIRGLVRRGFEVVVYDEGKVPGIFRHGPAAWVWYLVVVWKNRDCRFIFAVHGLHKRVCPALLFARKILRKKIIVLVHHLSSPLKYGRAARLERFFEKCFTDNADVVITASKYTAAGVAGLGVSPAEKICVIYPAADRRDYEKSKKSERRVFNILTVGTVEPRKGYDVLIESLARLTGDFDLTIAGDDAVRPEYVNKIRGLITSFGLEKKARLAGRVESDELESLFASADLYVQASYLEGFGISALEAAARGVPVVTTRVGAVPEIFTDGVSALFIDAGDAEGLRTAIVRLMEDRELREKLARGGRAINFINRTWDQVADEFFRVGVLPLAGPVDRYE